MRPSKELISWWRRILEAIDPLRPLVRDKIDDLYAERPDSPTRMIATRLRRSSPGHGQSILLYGARGAGKSSELSRLARELRDEYAVVQVDLGAGLPDQTSTLALVVLLGAAVLQVSKEWAGPDAAATTPARTGEDKLNKALAKLGLASTFLGSVLKHIAPILTWTGADSGVTAAATAALSTAGTALSHSADLRRELSRDPLAGRLPADRQDDARAVTESVNQLLHELEQLTGRPPLLLTDGLDKRTNIEDIQTALADLDLLVALEAPIILTGPVVLRHDVRFRGLANGFTMHSLPNIAVRKRGNEGGETIEENADGLALLRDIFERRMRAIEVLEAVEPQALDLAARMSSGIIREFLQILTGAGDLALDAGRRQITLRDVEAVVRRLRLSLQGSLNEKDWMLLARVLAKPGTLPADVRADVLLYENFIACYANGDLWFRPHEAIADSVASTVGDPDNV